MIVFLMLVEALLAVTAQLLLRHGAMKLSDEMLSLAIVLEPFKNVSIFSGLFLHAVSFFLYIYILSKVRLNVFYPIATGGTIVLVAVFSIVFLKEHFTFIQAVGILAILLGIVLVFLSSDLGPIFEPTKR